MDSYNNNVKSQGRQYIAFCLAFLLTTGTLLLASVVAYVAQSTKYPSSFVFCFLFFGSMISAILLIMSPILLERRFRRIGAIGSVLMRVCGKTIAYLNGLAFLSHSVLLPIGFYAQNYLDEGGVDMGRAKWLTLILISVLIVAFSGCIILMHYRRPEIKFRSWHEKGERILTCGDAGRTAAFSIFRLR